LGADECEATLGLLEENDMSFVCVDEPQGFASSMPPVVAATADLAVVRFHGRNTETWEEHVRTAAERFRYRYQERELREWVPKLPTLASSARAVHLSMTH